MEIRLVFFSQSHHMGDCNRSLTTDTRGGYRNNYRNDRKSYDQIEPMKSVEEEDFDRIKNLFFIIGETVIPLFTQYQSQSSLEQLANTIENEYRDCKDTILKVISVAI